MIAMDNRYKALEEGGSVNGDPYGDDAVPQPVVAPEPEPEERQQATVTFPRRMIWLAVLAALFTVALLAVEIQLLHNKVDNLEDFKKDANQQCNRKGSFGKQGVVATTDALATQAGLEILRKGGNAFDAALAVQFALNVVQPQSTGIGGGMFFLAHTKDGDKFMLDGREEAPEAFHAAQFCKDLECIEDEDCPCTSGAWDHRMTSTGGHPVGVPGVLAVVDRINKEHGTMPLSEIVKPAVRLARQGFPMYPFLHTQIAANIDRFVMFESSRKLFLPKEGNGQLELGEIFRNPDLADTFEKIAAEGGIESFYRGELMQEILDITRSAVHPVTNRSGLLKASDFDTYRAVYRKPLITKYREEWEVMGISLPGGGASLAVMLNLLEKFDLQDLEGAEFLHRLIDAQDIGFADRNHWMGDPDFVDAPQEGLADKGYALERNLEFTKSLQSAQSANGGPIPHGNPPSETELPELATAPLNPHSGTTHWVVADRFGNLVSVTSTLEENMGSAVVVPGRGFLLNNELTDFTALPRDPVTGRPYANRPQGGKALRRTALGADALSFGGKRPLSSMSPTIVLRKDPKNPEGPYAPYAALGSPGGTRIIGTVLNALVQLLDKKPSCVADAVDHGRVIGRNGQTLVEPSMFDSSEWQRPLEVLKQRGFDLAPYVTARPYGYLQAAVLHPDGRMEAVADTTRLPTSGDGGI